MLFDPKRRSEREGRGGENSGKKSKKLQGELKTSTRNAIAEMRLGSFEIVL